MFVLGSSVVGDTDGLVEDVEEVDTVEDDVGVAVEEDVVIVIDVEDDGGVAVEEDVVVVTDVAGDRLPLLRIPFTAFWRMLVFGDSADCSLSSWLPGGILFKAAAFFCSLISRICPTLRLCSRSDITRLNLATSPSYSFSRPIAIEVAKTPSALSNCCRCSSSLSNCFFSRCR